MKTIGVVICSYGSEHIKKSLNAYNSLIKQSVLPDEIKVVSYKSDKKLSEIRNNAISSLSTEYFCVLDADDELHENFIMEFHLGHGDIMNPLISMDKINVFRNSGNLEQGPYIIVGAPAKKDIFIKVGGFDERFDVSEDYHLWCKMYKAGATIGETNGIYYINYNPEGRNHKNGIEYCIETNEKIKKEVFG